MVLAAKKDIFSFYKDCKKHDSPNAGHPITEMEKSLNITLGGDTYYFGKLKHKACFGSGRIEIDGDDLKKALTFRYKIDIAVFVFFLLINIVLKQT
jgi:adenosylcobinamide-phosphate synthase